jgi:hypothetical protein
MDADNPELSARLANARTNFVAAPRESAEDLPQKDARNAKALLPRMNAD